MSHILEITRGKVKRAQKVLIYGPEGIGKTTLLSHFPGVVFLDTEPNYGSSQLDVNRLPSPSSWTMLLSMVKALGSAPITGTGEIKTLAVDTLDWAEKLCFQHIVDKFKKTGIEDFGYGKGYTYANEEWGRFLNLLQELVDRGINVACGAHAVMRKFEAPENTDTYDRWELKLQKLNASMTKEWADAILFCNYEVIAVKADDRKKASAQGGQRVIYTTHNPCWDGKNRWGLPDKIPMDFDSFGGNVPDDLISPNHVKSPEPATSVTPTPSNSQPAATTTTPGISAVAPVSPPPAPEEYDPVPFTGGDGPDLGDLDGLPRALTDLMRADNCSASDVQHAVAANGYYPEDTPITSYDPAFVQGVLIGAWPKVRAMIKKEG